MKRPNFIESSIVAFGLSFIASVIFSVMSAFLPTRWLLELIILGLSLGYVVYLLLRSSERIGRVTVFATWCAVGVASWFFSPSVLVLLMVQLGFIWLVRALYYYASVVMALADLVLVGAGVMVALWVLGHTESLFLALWCFFLMQSLFVMLPPGLSNRTQLTNPSSDSFEQAYAQAKLAIKKLSTQAK